MDDSTYKRNSNNFSFTDTFASLVNNEEFKEGYVELKKGYNNDKTYIWEMLSAVSEDVGETIFENVLNYIDNVSNINTCKLKALKSVVQMLGVQDFFIFNRLDKIPLDILNLMDIFSINRRYLLDNDFAEAKLVRDLISKTFNYDRIKEAEDAIAETVSENTTKLGLSSVESPEVIGSIDDDKYKTFLSSLFYKTIINHITEKYVEKDPPSSISAFNYVVVNIMKELRAREDTGIRMNFDSQDLELSSRVFELKTLYNLPYQTDYFGIAYNIDHGIESIDDYSANEQEIINLIFDRWSSPVRDKNNLVKEYSNVGNIVKRDVGEQENKSFFSSILNTRYAVYKEQIVKSYFDFADDVLLLSPYKTISVEPYELDKNYADLTYSVVDENRSKSYPTKTLILELQDKTVDGTTLEELLEKYRTGEEVLDRVAEVAEILAQVCLIIVNIRERAKSQAQKNHMIGTRLLIEYILSLYVKSKIENSKIYRDILSVDKLPYASNVTKNSKEQYPTITDDGEFPFYVNIIEYDDLTEYYNLNNLSSAQAKIARRRLSNTNPKFYEDLEGGSSFYGSGTGLGRNEISSFYMDNLNVASDILKGKKYYDFLSAVYEMGNDETFLSDKIQLSSDGISTYYVGTEGVLVFPRADSNMALQDVEDRSTIFLKYHGLSAGYYPWYNYKNQYHSSRQFHPFIYQFVEHKAINYVVGNAFYSMDNEHLLRLLQSEKISTVLGTIGNWIDVWKNELMDYSGYKSRYENSTHSVLASSKGSGLSCVDYDGTFYPPAVDQYLEIFNPDNEKTILDAVLEEYGYDSIDDFKNDIIDGKYKEFIYDGNSNAIIYGNKKGRHERLSISSPQKLYWWELDRIYLMGEPDKYGVYSGNSYDLYSNTYLINNPLDESNTASYNRFYSQDDSNSFYYFGKYQSYYQRWYSHLQLTPEFRRKLRLQLQNYYGKIADVTKSRTLSDETFYDIYAYGLDKNNNSYILYKQYLKENKGNYTSCLTADFQEDGYSQIQAIKKNTPGELWFKLKDHPIGFPAFNLEPAIINISGDKPKELTVGISQIALESKSFEKTQSTIDEFEFNAPLYDYLSSFGLTSFYDFELNYPKDCVVLAAKSSNTFDFSKATVFCNEIFQRHSFYGYVYDNDEYEPSYNKISPINGYDFLGFYPNENNTVYAAYIQKAVESNLITSVKLNAVEFKPDSQYDPVEFKFRDVSLQLNEKVPISTEFSLGYANEQFSLIFESEYAKTEDLLSVQNYIGYNYYRRFTEEAKTLSVEHPDLSSWTIKQIGRGNYNDDILPNKDYTSFDRFNRQLTILNVNENYLRKFYYNSKAKQPYVLNYSLNPDASYIPLYCGVRGQIKTWPIPSYDKTTEKSIELLGYSYQEVGDKINDIATHIFVDPDTQISTSTSLGTALSTNLRVYEDFNQDDYVQIIYSPFITPEQSKQEQVFSVTIDQKMTLTANINDLSVIVINTDTPSALPIISCPLSTLTDINEVRKYINYNGEDISEAEEYIYATGYPDSRETRVYGTYNVFEADPDNEHFSDLMQKARVNRIFNVKDFWLTYSETTRKLTLNFLFDHERLMNSPALSATGMAVSSKKIAALFFDQSLIQFEKYHYMEPFDSWPYFNTDSVKINQALSGLNQTLSEEDKYWYKRALFGNTKGTIDQLTSVIANNFGLDEDFLTNELKNTFLKIGNEYRVVNGVLSTEMESVDLGQYTMLDTLSAVPYIGKNQITFKISEESNPNLEYGFPPYIIEDILHDLFGRGTDGNKSFDNIYNLSNTYIFQLDNPFEIASLLSAVPVPIFSYRNNYYRAYEDFLSAQFAVDENGPDMIQYLKEYHYLSTDQTTVEDRSLENYHIHDKLEDTYAQDYDILSGKEVPNDTFVNPPGWNLDNDLIQSLDDLDVLEEILETSAVYSGRIDITTLKNTVGLVYHKTTVSEIDDFLKLYVCYKYETDTSNRTITMFFNPQNITNSPYLYQRSDGMFATEYKAGTFLTLHSGESGLLNVVLQYKYIDVYGDIQGVTNVTVARYKIWNVSDDKPKFFVSRLWRISDKDLAGAFGSDFVADYGSLVANDRYYGPDDLSSYVTENFKLEMDYIGSTTFEVECNSEISSLTCDFLYDTGYNSEGAHIFELLPEYSSDCDLKDDGGRAVLKMNNTNRCTVAFRLLEGTAIPTDTMKMEFNIELLKANAYNKQGQRVDLDLKGGTITFDFIGNNSLLYGRYLARELNYSKNPNRGPDPDNESKLYDTTHNKEHNSGWILTEAEQRVINMYNGGNNIDGSGAADGDGIPFILTTEDGYHLQLENQATKYVPKPIYV